MVTHCNTKTARGCGRRCAAGGGPLPGPRGRAAAAALDICHCKRAVPERVGPAGTESRTHSGDARAEAAPTALALARPWEHASRPAAPPAPPPRPRPDSRRAPAGPALHVRARPRRRHFGATGAPPLDPAGPAQFPWAPCPWAPRPAGPHVRAAYPRPSGLRLRQRPGLHAGLRGAAATPGPGGR